MTDRLRARTRRLAAPPQGQKPAVNAVLVQVQHETYAAPLAQLQAVLPVTVTPLPLGAPHVAGVQVVRGGMVGVVRADILLTGRGGPVPPEARVLLSATPCGPCGVLVDAVGDLIWVGEPSQPATFGTPGVSGLTDDGVACLDLEALLRHLPAPWPGVPPDADLT